MSVRTVAILSPGDMGHAVGRALGEHGLDAIACLRGRSERTSGLARAGNIRNVADLGQLVSEADLVLSIIPSASPARWPRPSGPPAPTPFSPTATPCRPRRPDRSPASSTMPAGGLWTHRSSAALRDGARPPDFTSPGSTPRSWPSLTARGSTFGRWAAPSAAPRR